MDISITLFANQLVYDIQTETRKSGFFQINQDNPEALNEAQLGSEQSDTDYIVRRCQQGVDSLLDVFHKFVSKAEIYETASSKKTGLEKDDDKITDIEKWVLALSFDGRRNIFADGLASTCHRYVEYHALYNWAVMTTPKLANEYLGQMQACELEIQKMVYHKEPPTRPTYS